MERELTWWDLPPGIALLSMVGLLIYAMMMPGNPHKEAGELYQCFLEGERVYASNERPEVRGGGWFYAGEKFRADECFCMGCAGF